MFLAVTPIEEFWDTSDELLFIGPWCAPYDRRARWGARRHRFLADPWRDVERFRTAYRYCRGVCDHLRAELATYLNAALGSRRGPRSWRILLDPWLSFHVEQMYDHYVHVQDALREVPGLRSRRLDPSCYETPRSTADFVRLKLGDFFHLQMFSSILAAKLPDSPTRRHAAPARPAPKKSLLKHVLARVLRAAVPAGRGEVLLGELGLSRGERLRLILGSRLKALPYLAELPESALPPPSWDERRRGLAGLPARDEFERIFIAALPRHFPTLFLEGHEAARRFTLSRLWRVPKIAFTTVGCHYDDAAKFALAECVERGGLLWQHQHGGEYGTNEPTSAEEFERAVCDRYYCWGWSKTSNDPKLRDLPAPMLTRGGPPRPGSDLLYISTSLDFHNIRLIRSANGDRALDYLDRQARFQEALPSPAKENLRVRLYPRDSGWRHRERLLARRPDMRFDGAAPLAGRLREARLAVVDYPSTPFLEALAADVPCVLTWSADAWLLRPEARPFFDALKSAGILFDSPEEAAAQAGRAYADPRAWWDEPGRRAARRDFAETFARSSPDWLDSWLKEIRQAVEAP